MCNIGSSDMPRLCTETFPKAKKSHTCCECGSTISPGEKYERIDGLWDDFATFKTCWFCRDVREQARVDFDLDYDEGFPFGGLWECVGMDYADRCP